jgi:6-phosphogluconolactonase (cycloisomerase 2 family)
MKSKFPLRALTAASIMVGLGLGTTGAIAGADTPRGEVHAVFALTDSTSGNSVLSYLAGSDGTISYAGNYSTGGLGLGAAGAVADPLASQGGLALIDDGNELVAVNSGSNTVSVFSVSGTQLRLLQIVPSGGLFPNSIATSGNLVTVLNAGGAGSVVEFELRGEKLVALRGQVRSLGLGNTDLPNFLMAPGQVGYSPNGQHLVVTTKLSTNSFEVFSVGSDGALGAAPVVTPATSPVPFAFNFDAAGNLVAVQASNSSVSTYTINPDGSLTALGSATDGLKALCWISSVNGYYFGSNAGSANISAFAESSTGAPVLVNSSAAVAHAGTTDSAVSANGSFLYVESGGAGTIDAYVIGAGGTLSQVGTVFDLPVASEGIVAS